jgi:hypothetical protein
MIIDYVFERSGETLAVVASNPDLSNSTPEYLADLFPPKDVLQFSEKSAERFGGFRIEVYRDSVRAAETRTCYEGPDANGIYWVWLPAEVDGVRDQWGLLKLYDNIVLLSWNEERATNARWHHLDTLLTGLIAGDVADEGDAPKS